MNEGRQRKIIHVDMEPSTRRSNNGTTRISATSRLPSAGPANAASWRRPAYEARKFGVRSAMPSVTAKRQCPDLIIVKPRFEVYKAVSQQIHEIFAEHTPIIEPLSLDEAYLDVTENLQGIPPYLPPPLSAERRRLCAASSQASSPESVHIRIVGSRAGPHHREGGRAGTSIAFAGLSTEPVDDGRAD
jgi:nucleotidyltransferase/DNA polymerase involved in DNA repair